MNTKALRQKILDLAIHGKLVPQDPSDEPASVLLERIRTEKERLIKEGKIKKPAKSKATCDKPPYPYQLPEGWEWTTLGDICKKLTDGSHNPPPKCPNGYTVISAQNIKNGKIVFTDKDRYADEFGFRKENPRTQITNGDIVLGIIGGSIGNVAIYDLSVPVIAQRSISIIDTYVSNLYCFYLLQSTIFQSLFLEKSIGNAQTGVYLGELDKLYIPLPPIAEQQRIVTEIDMLFALIYKIEQGNTNLHAVIQRAKSKILDLAIHGKLVPQDPSDEPASELLKRINPKAEITCDNPRYGKLPSGWRFVSVGSYVNLVTDFVASGSFASLRENVKYYNSPEYAILVRTKDFQNNFQKELVYTDKHGYEFLEKSNLHGGELVFSNVGSIGKVFIVPHLKQKMTLAPNAIMVRFHHDEHQKWFYYLFQSSIGLDLLHSITSATAIGKFNKTDFKKLVIPIPPLSEQHRIVAKIEELFAQLDKIEASL